MTWSGALYPWYVFEPASPALLSQGCHSVENSKVFGRTLKIVMHDDVVKQMAMLLIIILHLEILIDLESMKVIGGDQGDM